jgi:hypothetical protein
MTTDRTIRFAFKRDLNKLLGSNPTTKVVEELGVTHGAARIDVALIDGLIHGYELKSDADTLVRLRSQMKIYNLVFDKVTLIVGKTHLHNAIKIVPDWWGIQVAKISTSGETVFYTIREADDNKEQDLISIASLLWRGEALDILEQLGMAVGVRSKPKKTIYERLVEVMDADLLKHKVRESLCARTNWRVAAQYKLSDG